eukprot:TRINITY_DN4648_c0_g3_i1.p1 TRINITY_DN4648_c0_g3~~TRINITY_DN4648_c0_g3_i1.p1  ORF type:complete len:748 (-),score=161.29 TRINITY_DN4648_c0_g3_i1:184-2427(-)
MDDEAELPMSRQNSLGTTYSPWPGSNEPREWLQTPSATPMIEVNTTETPQSPKPRGDETEPTASGAVDSKMQRLLTRMSMRQSMTKEAREMAEKNASKAVFADSQAMKEKLHEHLAKPQYDVSNFYYEEGLFQAIARHNRFEQITLTVISLNALYISIDTDLNKATTLTTAAWPFQASEHAFCFYFTLEWFIRFMAFRRKRDGLQDFWFVFDSMMVAFMVTETWVLTLIFAYYVGGDSGGGNGGIFRLLRLLRLSRMARMAKLLNAMPELLILVKGMAAATRSVFFTLVLQALILYVFGIAFVVLSADSSLEETFPTVTSTMHTLLLYGTFLDNCGNLIFLMAEQNIIALFLYYAFVLLSALTVMNMLIGVLCEVISAVASVEHEALTVMYVVTQLQEIMQQGGLDKDGDGEISKKEFGQMMENAEAAHILSGVGVDVFALVELADYVFEAQEQLTFGDFMEVVLSLRGSNSATVKDVVDLRKAIQITNKKVADTVKTWTSKLTSHFERTSMSKLQAMGPTSAYKAHYSWHDRQGSQLAAQAAPLVEEVPLTPGVLPTARYEQRMPSLLANSSLHPVQAQGRPSTQAVKGLDYLRPELDRIRRLRTTYSTSMTRICLDLQRLHDASSMRPVRVPEPARLDSGAPPGTLISLPPIQAVGRKLPTAAVKHSYSKAGCVVSGLQKAPQLQASAPAGVGGEDAGGGGSGSGGGMRLTATLSVSVDMLPSKQAAPSVLSASVHKAVTREEIR